MTRRFSLHHAEALIAIADHGSVSAAARALGVAQSTVSSYLQQLEGEIGAVLIDRSTRSSRPTEAGKTFLEYARSLLSLADEAMDQVARVRCAPVAGALVIGGTTTVTEHLLPGLLSSFVERYPDVEVDLHVDNSAAITQRVIDGDLPLALLAAPCERPALDVSKIGTERQLVIAAGDHPLAGQHVDPHVLRGSRVLLREEGSATRQYQLELLGKWRIPAVHLSTIASTSAIIAAVEHRLGIACLPRAAAEHALLLGRVAELHLDPAPPERPIHLIRLADRPLTLIEELFLERVREEGTP
ncbi:LysR substrate-binding domain-containing protein [Saccharomonospora sp. NPDC046836]|uniref:LysR family transcriptional regulator n=1 Tax=Saccharomonospora sp. NPDC046836 TaxID=3156921 RepID=UPI0033F48B28